MLDASGERLHTSGRVTPVTVTTTRGLPSMEITSAPGSTTVMIDCWPPPGVVLPHVGTPSRSHARGCGALPSASVAEATQPEVSTSPDVEPGMPAAVFRPFPR
ncbi:hypothetical protein ACFYYN_09895 [Streptomyces sp. NPDC001902]